MENDAQDETLDARIAGQIRALRQARGWSLDELSARSGVSRASLSRLENAEVSPTAAVLGRLCGAFGMTMSRLLREVESDYAPLVQAAAQPVWRDPGTGFERRQVSPPSQKLMGEAIEGRLPAGARIDYELPPRPGLEHHLVLLEGRLSVTIEGREHALSPGDCLRYQLFGASRFETPAESGARYLLFLV